MNLNRYGEIVQKWWNEIPNHFPNVEIIVFVIMPNHVHGIILITDQRRGTVPVPQIDVQTLEQIYVPNNLNEMTSQSGDKSATPCEITSQGGEITSQGGEITSQGGEITSPLRAPTLGQVVAYFKYQSTKEMNSLDGAGTITKFWQRNYYEHIIRNEYQMDRIWKYIESNPANWASDDENPLNK